MNEEFIHIEAMDAYSRGEMTTEQRLAFEAQLATDTSLQSEWEIFQDLLGGVNAYGDRALRARIGAQHAAAKAKGLTGRRASGMAILFSNRRSLAWAAAATFALLMGAVWFWRANYNDPYAGEVAAAFNAAPAQRLPGLLDAMEAAGFGQATTPESLLLREGLQDYESGNYPSATVKLTTYLQNPSAPKRDDASFFLALSHLAQNQAPKAIKLLRPLQNAADPALRQEASFYLGLAYCRPPLHTRDARALLREVANDASSPHSTAATELLRKLDQ